MIRKKHLRESLDLMESKLFDLGCRVSAVEAEQKMYISGESLPTRFPSPKWEEYEVRDVIRKLVKHLGWKMEPIPSKPAELRFVPAPIAAQEPEDRVCEVTKDQTSARVAKSRERGL